MKELIAASGIIVSERVETADPVEAAPWPTAEMLLVARLRASSDAAAAAALVELLVAADPPLAAADPLVPDVVPAAPDVVLGVVVAEVAD